MGTFVVQLCVQFLIGHVTFRIMIGLLIGSLLYSVLPLKHVTRVQLLRVNGFLLSM